MSCRIAVICQSLHHSDAKPNMFSLLLVLSIAISLLSQNAFAERRAASGSFDCADVWIAGEAEHCAELGNLNGLVRLATRLPFVGDLSHLSRSETEELERVIAAATALVNEGRAEGYYVLGYAYWNGKGKPRDPKRAVRLMESAAKGGSPAAMTSLGLAYVYGDQVKIDHVKAQALLEEAARLGDFHAKDILPRFHKMAEYANYTEARGDVLLNRLQEAAKGGNLGGIARTIEEIANLEGLAPRSIPLMIAIYPRGDRYTQDRILRAIIDLGYLTSNGAVLLAREATLISVDELPNRINWTEDAGHRNLILDALALGRERSAPALRMIEPFLVSDDVGTRMRAFNAFVHIQPSEVEELIVDFRRDPSPLIRLEVESARP